MASKLYIFITVLQTCRRKISILNTKYYESPFENFGVRKNDIMITEISKNNSNKLNNEYYNLESIFEKFILLVYYVPRRIMRVITRRATMLAGDRSQSIVEA